MALFRDRSSSALARRQIKEQEKSNRLGTWGNRIAALGVAVAVAIGVIGLADRWPGGSGDVRGYAGLLVTQQADLLGDHDEWLFDRATDFGDYPTEAVSSAWFDSSALCDGANSSPDDPATMDWFTRANALSTSVPVYLTLQADTRTEVRISFVEIDQVTRVLPAGDFISVVPCESGRGDISYIDTIEIDFAQSPTNITVYSDDIPGRRGDLSNLTVTVPAEGSTTLLIYAFLDERSTPGQCVVVEWTARLHAVVDGESQQFTIDNDGEPFFVASGSRAIQERIYNPTREDLSELSSEPSNLRC